MTVLPARRIRGYPSECAAAARTVFIASAFAGAIAASSSPGPAERLAEAIAAPCSAAPQLYESLASEGTVPDSLRAVACGRRADYAFALHDYRTARDYYDKASRFNDRRGVFKYRSGLAALQSGDTVEAEKILFDLTKDGKGATQNEAAMLLGEIALQRGDFVVAMADFQSTGPFVPMSSWSICATAGKLVCARRLSHADSAAAYERLLSPHLGMLLEKKSLALTPPVEKKAVEGQGDTWSAPSAPEMPFTLQIGAFGSHDRAEAAKKRLMKQFGAVSCIPATSSNRTVYRVRIGDFPTHEEAERFGKERLLPRGLTYNIVKK